MKTIEPGRLAARIIKHLYELDCEANQPARDFPTGLNWYGGFTRPDLTKPRTEPEWSRRLAEKLRGDQITANRRSRLSRQATHQMRPGHHRR